MIFIVLQIVIVNYLAFLCNYLLLFTRPKVRVYVNISAPILNLTKPHIVKITFS